MNWEAIGATGEVLGAVVVVATLVYLSIQLRQNTIALRSNQLENWLSNASSVNDFRAEHSEVLAKAFSGETLSTAEEMVIDALAQKLFLLMETTFLHYKDGTLPEDVFDSRLAGVLRGLEAPPIKACWENSKGYSLSPEFVRFMESKIAKGGA